MSSELSFTIIGSPIIPALGSADSWTSLRPRDSFLADGLIREAGNERSGTCSGRFFGGGVAAVGRSGAGRPSSLSVVGDCGGLRRDGPGGGGTRRGHGSPDTARLGPSLQ